MDPSPSVAALAHPVRARAMAHLRTHGPTTSADLARALGSNTGVTSYHLRLLGEAGLVVDEPGPGRRRLWAVSPDAWSAPEGPGSDTDPDEAALATWLEHDLIDLFATRAHRQVDAAGDGGQGAAGLQDDPVLVTLDQALALRAELDAVLARYRRIGQGTPGARRVVAWTALLPVD